MKTKYHKLKPYTWLVLLVLSMALKGDDLELIATFEGNPNCDSTYFGRYCLFLGDINADGFGDMAIVSQAGEDTTACPYTMKFFWGGPDFDTIPDMILTRDSALYCFGASYGTNGDLNGDGVADLVVGTHLGFYILFGKPDITPEFDLFVPETSHVQYDFDNYPTQIIIDGDFNGDGYDD
ncbi:MAG: VCBS repeat-containing protein, partial [FCB group bacterium]|nr:VCBS repeat-containing protein [FCB group bacterium]